MGHRLDPGQEADQLKAIIREAHEVTQELSAVIKEAKGLTAAMVDEFQRIHESETRQLSNFFISESNRHAAGLNADIERARKMIMEQIMNGEAVFDRLTDTVGIRWGNVRFDDHQPLPYPDQATQEKTQ